MHSELSGVGGWKDFGPRGVLICYIRLLHHPQNQGVNDVNFPPHPMPPLFTSILCVPKYNEYNARRIWEHPPPSFFGLIGGTLYIPHRPHSFALQRPPPNKASSLKESPKVEIFLILISPLRNISSLIRKYRR